MNAAILIVLILILIMLIRIFNILFMIGKNTKIIGENVVTGTRTLVRADKRATRA